MTCNVFGGTLNPTLLLLYKLQAIHPIYYITLTKMDCQLTSEMNVVKMIILHDLLVEFHDHSHFP